MIADARLPAERHDLPRCCSNDNGAQKMAFPTRRDARDYAIRMLGSRFFTQYRCPACDWYHNAMRRAAQ